MHDEKLSLTPLIDVAFLVLIFFMALPMKRLDTKLSAHLPVGHGHAQFLTEPRSVVKIHVRQDGFRLGDTRAESAWSLVPLIQKLGPTHVYQIAARPKVGTQNVIEVMDVLTGLKYTQVEFAGVREPSQVQRDRRN